MATPIMFIMHTNGTLDRIPDEDAAVFDRYREPGTLISSEDAPLFERYPAMPLVYEPQAVGDPCPLFPLIDQIDEDGGYRCYPMPGTITEGLGGRPVLTTTLGPDPFTPKGSVPFPHKASGVAA